MAKSTGSNSVKPIFMLLMLLFLSGCDESGNDGSSPKELARVNVSENCTFWVDVDDRLSVIRAGVSGACTEFSLKDYAHELQLVFSGLEDSGKYDVIYLNMHDGSRKIAADIESMVLSSNKWNNCSNEIDKCFLDVVNETGYFEVITDVIHEKFGSNYILSFIGVECKGIAESPTEDISDGIGVVNNCVPLSFGLATYEKS